MNIFSKPTVVIIMAAIAAVSAIGQTVAPPNSNPHGASYDEWGDRWWEWIFSIPAEPPSGLPNPLFSDGAVNCGIQQPSDKVWFLAGKFCLGLECSAVVTANRSCNVPFGTALFVPVLNAWADNVAAGSDGGPGDASVTDLETAACNSGLATQLHASIDGRPVPNLFAHTASTVPVNVSRGNGQLMCEAVRSSQPGFSYTFPGPNNLDTFLGFPVPGLAWPRLTVKGAAEYGYYLMVEPLPVGMHTLNFGGTGQSGFQIDITYKIQVTPRR